MTPQQEFIELSDYLLKAFGTEDKALMYARYFGAINVLIQFNVDDESLKRLNDAMKRGLHLETVEILKNTKDFVPSWVWLGLSFCA